VSDWGTKSHEQNNNEKGKIANEQSHHLIVVPSHAVSTIFPSQKSLLHRNFLLTSAVNQEWKVHVASAASSPAKSHFYLYIENSATSLSLSSRFDAKTTNPI